jgi:hypothetical protein
MVFSAVFGAALFSRLVAKNWIKPDLRFFSPTVSPPEIAPEVPRKSPKINRNQGTRRNPSASSGF